LQPPAIKKKGKIIGARIPRRTQVMGGQVITETDLLHNTRQGLTLRSAIETVGPRINGTIKIHAPWGNVIAGSKVERWSHNAPKHLWLFEMETDLNHRREGFLREIVTQAEEVARKNGLAGLALQVRTDNKEAIAAYKKLGFKKVSKTQILWNKTFIPVYEMHLEFKK
jgi:ribosomal protein S18 acetylase RimI-like enzyme